MRTTTSSSPQQVLALLGENLRRLTEATAGVPERRLSTRPATDEWSAVEVLAHLRACADVWGGCIARLLTEHSPTIRAVNPRTWVESTDYGGLAFRPSFDAFRSQRHDLLARLDGLPDEAWQRAGTVTGAGRPLERTVLSYAQWLATHERPHVRQIARSVAS